MASDTLMDMIGIYYGLAVGLSPIYSKASQSIKELTIFLSLLNSLGKIECATILSRCRNDLANITLR